MMTAVDLEHFYVPSAGVKLHVVAAGPADAPTVILLHGFPEYWKSWERVIGPLTAAGYRVVVPDQRGYNLSDKPERVADYRLDRLAEDVLAILDHLGVDRASIAGHDFGATVTWWLLTFHPERFGSAAILNVPHPIVLKRWLRHSWRQNRKSWYMYFFQLPRVPEYWFARGGWRFGTRVLARSSRPGTFRDADLEDYRRAWVQPGAIRSMIHWYRAAFRFPSPERRPASWQVTTPVLILWGEEDRFLSKEMAEESLQFCRDGRCVRLPGISHWIQHEEPERVAAALIEHFGRETVAARP
jgi:pimeloyl-ACP methyl ester carboxylesterase